MGEMIKMTAPTGYYEVVKDWISATKLSKKKHIKKLHFDNPVILTEPIGLEEPNFWTVRFSEAAAPFRQRNGIVDIIPGGRIFGAKPDILTPDHKLIWKHSREKYKLPEEHSIFQLNSLPLINQNYDTVALLSIMDSGVYYHWMLDVLPRLHMLKLCGITPSRYVINGKKLAPFQYETLEALGVSREKVIESHDGLHLQAKKLVIPHFTRGIRPRWVCDYLRQELMINKNMKPIRGFEKLFISRTRASKRKLLNEAEVYEYLRQFGFQRIVLEDLSVSSQIQLFASAKVIAAPHGAGLTNALFSNPGATVIEFFAPSLVHNCYPILSSLVGHKHYYIIGEGERPPEYVDPHDRSADITVNMKDLKKILKRSGIV
ncbi:Protein of unknown function [Paenibacillus sp. yr247]|uniref:glycosyltransferase family 61 protein n=1 Tax=Paenibacillus sp. yr247 TaxID=1761880 RepID=UPI00088D5204|nr:glycosyltransferase family 61 protein [Paenibacillus sp. yr247]SDN59811.1 Protein of unknown function [Paenibacillus sp. yr247]